MFEKILFREKLLDTCQLRVFIDELRIVEHRFIAIHKSLLKRHVFQYVEVFFGQLFLTSQDGTERTALEVARGGSVHHDAFKGIVVGRLHESSGKVAIRLEQSILLAAVHLFQTRIGIVVGDFKKAIQELIGAEQRYGMVGSHGAGGAACRHSIIDHSLPVLLHHLVLHLSSENIVLMAIHGIGVEPRETSNGQ